METQYATQGLSSIDMEVGSKGSEMDNIRALLFCLLFVKYLGFYPMFLHC
ncbi:MAG: hypothetical protein OFPI_32850 [Osedax symbiont Rs2]|nr:MAG: hypothetical protein OFPI_32850 [Osedax symbiont Rs2]